MKNRGVKKRPKNPSHNHIDRMVLDLQDELKKYTHFTKDQIEKYYFTKRLLAHIEVYNDFIKHAVNQTLLAANSVSNLKRVTRLKKKKK